MDKTKAALNALESVRIKYTPFRPIKTGLVRTMMLDALMGVYTEYREIPSPVRAFAFEVDAFLTAHPDQGLWAGHK